MLTLRPSQARGHVQMAWLDTRHTFSFGSYYDPRHMGSSVLRVINDDRIAPHSGFGIHGHRNMEILTLMLEGTLTHRDSMSNLETLQAGEYQLMSAGRGVMHSEMNAGDVPVHLLQIWVQPNETETPPGYRQALWAHEDGFTLIASPEGEGDSFRIRQDARIWRAQLPAGHRQTLTLGRTRTGWLQLIRGGLNVDGQAMQTSDGLEIREQEQWTLTVTGDADFLYFDLPNDTKQGHHYARTE